MEDTPLPSLVLPPRIAQIENWVFDLDNTLYPASCSLFPQIDIRMRQFIAGALHLSLEDAFVLQKQYYHHYGTTLRGLMLVHHIEPADFLAYVHDIDCSVLDPAPRLDAALNRLPGRKIIFTNGSERHALNVLDRLGLTRHFDGIFDIKAAGFIPKPNAACYDAMLRRHAINAKRAAMFEDLPRNLVPAAAIGMTTVLVRENGHSHWTAPEDTELSHIDHVTDDLADWLEMVTPSA